MELFEARAAIASPDYRLGYVLPEDINSMLERAESFAQAAKGIDRQARWMGLR